MTCASGEIILAEVGEHTTKHDVFHDVYSILYTAYPMAAFQFSSSENLTLFMVSSIHWIRKYKKQKLPKQIGTQNAK